MNFSFGQLSIVFPKTNQHFSTSDNIEFILSGDQNSGHEFQLSTDQGFTTVLFDTVVFEPKFNKVFSNLNGEYHIRSKYASDIDWSNSQTLGIVDITNNAEMWLRTDSLEVEDGKVSIWYDKTGNGNHSTQTIIDRRPSYINENDTSLFASIELDGDNDYLTGNPIPNINNSSFNLFLVHSGNYQNNNIAAGIFNIGGNSNMYIYRRFFSEDNHISYFTNNNFILTTPGILPRTGYPKNIICISKEINNLTTVYMNNSVVGQSTSSSINSSFTNTSYRIGYAGAGNLNGSFSEIILINNTLTPTEKDAITNYAMDRYSPPINLGKDISISYGFCDTTVGAKVDIYSSYLWSTGDTTSTINIVETGVYWLQTEDIFGRVSSDSIEAIFPDFSSIILNNLSPCYNESNSVEAFVPSGEYFFNQWSDGNTNPIRTLLVNENISYSVNDTLGCSRSSNVATITIDNSLEGISLGIDTSLCVGNSIELDQTPSNISDFQWNTGNSSSIQIVDTSGTYMLDVINDNGCENSDTIEVTIIGDAPELSYSIPTEICQGGEFSYSENSTVPPGNNISEVVWNFGDLDSSYSSFGTHAYIDSGIYSAYLEVSTLEGCSSKDHFSITVYPKPIISFETENYCPYEEISFSASNDLDVPLFFYNWEFGQNSSSSTDVSPSYNFGLSGNYDVQLISVDTNNCADTVIQNVFIQPAPVADIAILNPCELSALEITDNSSISDTFSIVTYSWDYGDNTSAVNPVEDKFYDLYGEYTVQLALTANNGCVDSTEQNITVHPNPIVDYAVGPACMGTWTTLTNLSMITMGTLVESNWLINLQYTDNQTNTAFNFPTTGIQLVNLESVSIEGCAVDTTFEIDVSDELKADFLVTPSALTTGTPILFSNQSIGMDSSFWNFGDGNGELYNMSSLNEITYDNSLNGSSIDVSLVIVNNLGCRDTSTKTYELKEAFFDLAVQTIFVQDINGFLTVGAEIQNLGSVPLENAELYLKTPESSPILENWTGFLAQNESEIYIFNAHPPSYTSTQDETERFICVEGNGINSLEYLDIDFSNNTACKNIEGSGLVVLPIYPNPTEEDITISILLTEASPLRIELVDQSGRLIFNQYYAEKLETGIHNIQLPFSSLQKGIYHVRVSDESSTLLEKIVRY